MSWFYGTEALLILLAVVLGFILVFIQLVVIFWHGLSLALPLGDCYVIVGLYPGEFGPGTIKSYLYLF